MRSNYLLPATALPLLLCMWICSVSNAVDATRPSAASTVPTAPPPATDNAHTHGPSPQRPPARPGVPTHPDELSAGASTASHDDLGFQSVAKPFVVDGAKVRGPVGSRLQAELEQSQPPRGAAAGLRGLLHGPKRPKSFPKCGACRIVRCNRGRTYCSGHCRQKRKLFFCDTTTTSVAACIPSLTFGGDDELPTIEDYNPRTLPSISQFDQVVLTAEAPYMACAEFADGRNGCPARGTPAEVPGFGSTVLLATRCRVQYYIPTCQIPLLPFGACECFYRDPRPQGTDEFGQPIVRMICGTCRPAHFPGGASVGAADGVMVQQGDNVTTTSFFNFAEPGREPEFQTRVTAQVGPVAVSVSLSMFLARVETRSSGARVLREGVAIPADYDYEPDRLAPVEDYESEAAETGVYYQYE